MTARPLTTHAFTWTLVLCAAGLSFALRMDDASSRITEAGIAPLSSDAHFYLHRIYRTFSSFPGLPESLDPALACPDGSVAPWPMGPDLIAAGFAVAVFGSGADRADVETAAAVLPPLIAALTCVLIAALGMALVGRRAAVIAALLCAVTPIHVGYTAFGEFDHHMFNPVWLALAAIGLVRGGRGGLFASALAIAACLGTTTEAWIEFTLLAAAGCIGVVGGVDERRPEQLRGLVGWAWVVFGLSLPVIATAPYTRAGIVAGDGPSRFTWWILAAIATGISAAYALRRAWQGQHNGAARVVIAAGIAGIAAGLCVAVGAAVDSEFGGAVGNAVAWAGRAGMVQTIWESQPLWQRPFPEPITLLTPAFCVAPLAFVGRRNTIHLAARALVFLTLTLAIVQVRFAMLALVPVCIAVADAAFVSNLRSLLVRRAITVFVCFAAIIGGLASKQSGALPAAETDRRETLAWLANNRPIGETNPCLLGPWDVGHKAIHVGRQRVVASNFTESDKRDAILASYRFLLERSVDAGEQALAARRVGLVWAESLQPSTIIAMSAELGRPPPSTLSEARAMLGMRLVLSDGAAIEPAAGSSKPWLPAVGYLRLVHASNAFRTRHLGGQVRHRTPATKLFLRVRGALLDGKTTPGATVQARLRLQTDGGYRFVFRAAARADDSGEFRLRVPYATDGSMKGVKALAPYTLAIVDPTASAAVPTPRQVTVSELAVHAGSTVRIGDR